MLYLILFFSVIFNFMQNITGTIDCDYYVRTDSDLSRNITYKGCKVPVLTACMDNLTSPNTDVYNFKGIPFAESPVNDLRFQKPIPKRNFENSSYDATYFRNPCMQIVPVDFPLPSGLPNEDCLYLNVYTPTLNESAKLPVMFWIYGGGYFIGSGSELFFADASLNIYDGSLFARRDVILVTSNYRLGVFGFLNGNRADAPGNARLWDQAMALNWTRQNIQNFGGDPDRITIFGESSGSISCSAHIVSPITRNWFQRAILESGSAYGALFSKSKDYIYSISRKFANNAFLLTPSCNGSDMDWIQCLKGKSSDDLLVAQTLAILWNADQPFPVSAVAPFQSIYGDEFLPISVNKAVKVGDFRRDIKILIGHNEMEGSVFVFVTLLLKIYTDRYNPFIPTTVLNKAQVEYDIKNYMIDNDTIGVQIAKDYMKGFNDIFPIGIPALGISPNPNPIRQSAVHASGDYVLMCPTVLFGGYVSQNQTETGKVYQYRYTHIPQQSTSFGSAWAKSTHTDEVPLVFGKPFDPLQSLLWNSNDKKLSIVIMGVWTDFAKYGVLPTVNGNVWPPYSRKSDNSTNATYLELNANDALLGKVHVDKYRGNDGYTPSCIQNCFNYWDSIFNGQF